MNYIAVEMNVNQGVGNRKENSKYSALITDF